MTLIVMRPTRLKLHWLPGSSRASKHLYPYSNLPKLRGRGGPKSGPLESKLNSLFGTSLFAILGMMGLGQLGQEHSHHRRLLWTSSFDNSSLSLVGPGWGGMPSTPGLSLDCRWAF